MCHCNVASHNGGIYASQHLSEKMQDAVTVFRPWATAIPTGLPRAAVKVEQTPELLPRREDRGEFPKCRGSVHLLRIDARSISPT